MAGFFRNPRPETKALLAEKAKAEKTIRSFVDGWCGEWEWEDFVTTPSPHPEIEEVRLFCILTQRLLPPDEPGDWCSAAGVDALHAIQQRLARELRAAEDE